MGKVHAYAYGADVVLLESVGATAPTSQLAHGVRPVPGGYDTPVCWATRKDGMPCQASPISGGSYCIGHARQHGEA